MARREIRSNEAWSERSARTGDLPRFPWMLRYGACLLLVAIMAVIGCSGSPASSGPTCTQIGTGSLEDCLPHHTNPFFTDCHWLEDADGDERAIACSGDGDASPGVQGEFGPEPPALDELDRGELTSFGGVLRAPQCYMSAWHARCFTIFLEGFRVAWSDGVWSAEDLTSEDGYASVEWQAPQAPGTYEFLGEVVGSVPALTATYTRVVTGELDPRPTGENLLVDPGYETSEYRTGTSPVIPNEVGYWKGDLGAFVTGTQSDGVAPGGGSKMLRCSASGPFGGGAGSTGCESYQLVDVSRYSALIDQDSVRVSAAVRVNRVALDAETDREFRLVVYALSGGPSTAPSGLGTALASWTEVLVSDGEVATWERIELATVGVPAGTRTLVLRLVAHEDVFDDPGAGEFDGHYFDDAELTLSVP